MSPSSLVSSPAEPPGPADTSATRLSGHWLVLARGLWIAVALFAVTLFVASLPIALALWQRLCPGTPCPSVQLTAAQARLLRAQGLSLAWYATFWVGISVLLALGYMGTGALIFWRRSDDWLALLGAFFLVLLGATLSTPLTALVAVAPAWRFPADCLFSLGPIAFIFFFCLFPTGRFTPRWAPWVAAVSILDATLGPFFPYTVLDTFHWPQPYWTLEWVSVHGSLLFVVLYRYRYFLTPVQRQQTKWAVVGAMVAFACSLLPDLFLAIFFPGAAERTGFTTLPLLGVIVILYLAYLLIPLAFGMAILRSHLWEIDTLINKALVYGALTALLAALYAGLIIGLEAVAGAITGGQTTQPVVLVLSTLAIAALFLPARRRIQQLIDRRFYRKKYDAEQTLASFSATLRQEVDLEQIQAQLLAVVSETMQPAHVSLWLRQPERHHTEQAHPLEPHSQVPTRPSPD
jgi:hypothetical protein